MTWTLWGLVVQAVAGISCSACGRSRGNHQTETNQSLDRRRFDARPTANLPSHSQGPLLGNAIAWSKPSPKSGLEQRMIASGSRDARYTLK